MSDEPEPVVIVLDDEQAVLDSAGETFPKRCGRKLETTLLNRNNSNESLKNAIDALAKNKDNLLLIDWLPVKKNQQMLQQLVDWRKNNSSPEMTQIILCSWQPPWAFKADVEQFGLGQLRRLHKPLRWEDVLLPDTLEKSSAGTSVVQQQKTSPLRRRRLIHVAAGRYRVHPVDTNETAFWPLPQFKKKEIECLLQGQQLVSLYRGWLPWAERSTAMDWYQLLTVVWPRKENRPYPESLWQYAIPHPDEPWQPPAPNDAVDNIFKLMAEVGFHRGRYYEIDQLPDERKTLILQLTRANHEIFYEEKKQKADDVLPVAKELTGELLERAKEFVKDYKNKKNELVYKVRERCGESDVNQHTENTTFWNELVCATNLSARLEFPVYRNKSTETPENQGSDISSLLGWMIFDRLAEDSGANGSQAPVKAKAATEVDAEKTQIEERVKIVESLVLQAIAQVRGEREERQNRQSGQQSQFRKDFRQGLGEAASREMREMDLVSFAMQAGGLDPNRQDSSVIYARYDAADKSLTVVQDSTEKLLGQVFPISSNFALARCAASKKLRVVPNWNDLSDEEKIYLIDWQNLPGMDDSKANELFSWAANEILTTVALPVLSKGDTLLGVLLERHKRPYHFSRQRIDNLQALVDTALPYLELDAARAMADTWDGAVMHEIRSGVQVSYQSLHALLRDASLSAGVLRAIRGALYGFEDLRDLSNMFLENIGKKDPRTRLYHYSGDTGDDWFKQIDAYGSHRADAWDGLKAWQAEILPAGESALALAAPDKLIRVLRILIDNAFRYGQVGTLSESSSVRLVVNQERQGARFMVASQGEFSASILQGRFRNHLDRLDLGGRSLRVHLGLSLADGLIREQGQELSLNNRPANQTAVAEFIWPCAASAIGASEKGR